MGSKPGPDVSLSCNTDGFCSILPTASVSVMSASGPVKATLIFDSGSDRTYVSEQLMRKVGGKWKGSMCMNLMFVELTSLNPMCKRSRRWRCP